MQNKANTTGLQDFDRIAAPYSVHTIERVYPFLDHVEPMPQTRRNLLALRRTYYVRYHADVASKPVAKTLTSVPGVVYAEPVPVNRTFASGPWTLADPNDPMFSDQTERMHLRLPEAWDMVKGIDGGVVIAIVDGGGEWRHEDLHANVWTNVDEIADNRLDDDDNGFIDDVHGVNYANGDRFNNDPTGLPETPGSANHGTAAAAAASAVSDNGVGVSGAAWNAEIMHINTACRYSDLYFCYGYEGLLYAAANGADIINASWGSIGGLGGRNRFYDQSLDLVTDMGALVVASAGNHNASNDVYWYYPARHPRVLSVGATEKDTRRKAGFSVYGKLVNVFAPGVNIVTTGSNNEYVRVNGTSFASPLVAGVAALVKTQFPDLSPDALREQVRLASENIDDVNPGLERQLGRGYVNALAAIQTPTVPGVRLKRWSWVDDDGDGEIASGDVVTVMATVINHLVDATQLRVELVPAGPYTFIDITRGGVNIGFLARGDSTEVQFAFTVSSDAPTNQWVRFHMGIREGAFVDEVDQLSFDINKSIAELHHSLSALYTATGGDEWTDNSGWDITRVPDEGALGNWYGLYVSEGWLLEIALRGNNLTGMLPAELSDLPNLQLLLLDNNALSGALPRSFLQLTNLQVFRFGGGAEQTLCAPADDEFQTWLSNILIQSGPTCAKLQFAKEISDQWFTIGTVISMVLPQASGGVSPHTYNLTPTTLPAGLAFNDTTRTISGEPTEVTAPVPYTWSVTDQNGAVDSVQFTLEVVGRVAFVDGIPDQSFPRAQPIPLLVLPEAQGGTPYKAYTLLPSLPAGLRYDAHIRTLRGTPIVVTSSPIPYRYKAIDGNGSADSLQFTIEVYSPTAVEPATVPESFTIHGNYPNPFGHATRLVMDLPWPARVMVNVLDVTGRRVLEIAPVQLSAGWNQELVLMDVTIPSGLYLYKLHVASPEGDIQHTGRFVRIR